MNVFDYIKENGNKSFKELEFNEIDNVIFSQIVYLPLKGIVTGRGISIYDACNLLEKKNDEDAIKSMVFFVKKSFKMMQLIKDTVRYKNVILSNYEKKITKNKQFGALKIEFDDNVYIAFEGTDDSIVGWYEDLQMSYMYPIPSQIEAKRYLNSHIDKFYKHIYVGGHSKGGNLAIYAAMNSKIYIRLKIKRVFSNDGPGFNKKIVKSLKYKYISHKVRRFIPSESLFGILLYQNDDLYTVKSSKIGVLQHDVFNWQIDDNKFISGELSNRSRRLANEINELFSSMNPEDLKAFVDDLYKQFKDSEIIKTTDMLEIRKSLLLFKNIRKMDNDFKKKFFKFFTFK